MKHSKRDWLALGSRYIGLTRLIGSLPGKPALLILNYHRIGDAASSAYDPWVFSATAQQFDRHVAFLKRYFHLVGLEEAIGVVENRIPLRRTAVLLTFDDGYLDNYQLAFPILSSHGAKAVFFLPTAFIGAARITWWDSMAYIVRRTRHEKFRLAFPAPAELDLTEGLDLVLARVYQLYMSDQTIDPERFLAHLEEACDSPRPDGSERCFMNWEEAAEMLRGGMDIGSHTDSHEILGQLTAERQIEELKRSRRILQDRLRTPALSLAYPIGLRHTFNDITRAAAESAGYRVAFSYYGGFNLPGSIDRYNVRRVGVGQTTTAYFELRAAIAGATGKWLDGATGGERGGI